MTTPYNPNLRDEDIDFLLDEGFESAEVEKYIVENRHRYSTYAFERRMAEPEAPFLLNEDGSQSTHRMASGEWDGRQVAFPTIIPDAKTESGLKQVTMEEAAEHARKTGEFRTFGTSVEAENYARGNWKPGGNEFEASESPEVNEALQKTFAEYIAGNEGYIDHIYPDAGGESYGFGHFIDTPEERETIQAQLDFIDQLTDPMERDNANQALALQYFESDVTEHVKRAKNLFPSLTEWSTGQQMAVIDGVYRGSISRLGSPDTFAAITAGEWDKASREHMNSKEIQASKEVDGGVFKRESLNAKLMLPPKAVPKIGKEEKPTGLAAIFEGGSGEPGEFLSRVFNPLNRSGKLDVFTRAKYRTVALFADTYTPQYLTKVTGFGAFELVKQELERVVAGEGLDLLNIGKRKDKLMQDYLDNMNEIKEKYEHELAENPAETGLESFVEAGAGVAAIMPDFIAMGYILAPIKGIAALKWLKNYPRLAKFFAESQHSAATFAGVESKHGLDAMVDGYLAGMAFHVAGLPKNPLAKSMLLGITGKLTAKLQGADETQANAQALLFMLLPLVGMGKGRRKGTDFKPAEYKTAKQEFLRITDDAGVPKKNALEVIKDVETLAEGNIPNEMAQEIRGSYTDSTFRRVVDRAHAEVKKAVDKGVQPLDAFMETLDSKQRVLRAEEQFSGVREEPPLRSAREINLEQPEVNRPITKAEKEAKVREVFKPEKHPGAPEKPKGPTVAKGESVERLATKEPKNADRLKRFKKHMVDGKVLEARKILTEVQEQSIRLPQDEGVQAVRSVMEDVVRKVDTGTAVKDQGNKFLRQENTDAYNKSRRQMGALTGKLGWDDLRYRAFLKEEFGVDSSRLLTADQTASAILKLRERAGEVRPKVKTGERVSTKEPGTQRAPSKIRPENGKVGKVEILTLEQEQSINTRLGKLRKEGMTTDDRVYVFEQAGLKPDHKVGFNDVKDFTTKAQAAKLSKALQLYEETIGPIRAVEAATLKDAKYGRVYASIRGNIGELLGGKAPSKALSMRYYAGKLEEISGGRLPFFSLYENIIKRRNLVNSNIRDYYKRLADVNGEQGATTLAEAMGDPKVADRISDYIGSKSKHKNKPAEPKDITQAERNIANEIMKVLDEYKWKFRAQLFYEWKFRGREIKGFNRYKSQIEVADKAYEQGGQEALFTVLKAQDWGVLETGFEPHEGLFRKGIIQRSKGLGKGKARQERVYEYQKQDKNMFLRVGSYLKRTESGLHLTPQVEAFDQLYKRGIKEKVIPETVGEDLAAFLGEIQGTNFIGGPVERALKALYGQSMKTLIVANPAVAFRNLFQNMAFYPDRTNLVDPRNRALTAAEERFLMNEVYQDPHIDAWAHSGDALFNNIPGLRVFNKIADKVSLYGWSDRVNRRVGFWAKKNAVERAMASNKPIEAQLKDAKFSDMSNTQQKRALEVLATEGKDAFGNYVAKATVEDVHFIYDRAQRSPAELFPGSARLLTNLALFPRAYAEKMVRSAQKVKSGIEDGKITPEGARALKVIMSVMVGGYLNGELFVRTTGRQDNPYSPATILGYTPGGLMLSSVVTAGQVGADIFTLMNPLRSMKDKEREMGRLMQELPRLGDMYIPFYMLAINGFEAASGASNIDREALRIVRETFDSEYKRRKDAYDIDRSAFEAWQHFLFGSGVDVSIREREAEKKKASKVSSGSRSRGRGRERR